MSNDYVLQRTADDEALLLFVKVRLTFIVIPGIVIIVIFFQVTLPIFIWSALRKIVYIKLDVP